MLFVVWAPLQSKILATPMNSSQYDPCAFCGLKVDSDKRKKKKKHKNKVEKIRKNLMQGGIKGYDHDKGRK